MKNKNFIGRLRCILFLMALASSNYLSAQTGPNDDFDGDGIINSIDIDDDNDGVPDAVENPSCFYAASEWNTGVKPATNGVTVTSALTTTLGNFGQLLDNVPATTAVTFTAGQPIQNANVYLFTFAQAVRLDAVYLKFNTLTQFGGTTKIQGSNTNNGSDWVDLSAATSTVGTNVTANGLVEVTNSIKYPVTLNTATSYRYIRITGVAVSNTAAQNASEVYFDFNVANYVASHYPKATCTDANIDGDGILPHFDLDSDGDGCSDAYEAGATTNLATNYKFTGAVGVNGLDNTLETSDNGIINYASTYYVYAQNSAMQICKDTDGDGILDINDIDDDNDGVLDTAEQVVETCSGVFTADSRVIWNSTFTNANTTATGNATINGTPISVTATTTKVFKGLMNDHWHYGSGNYVGCPDVTTIVNNSVLNIENNDYTVTYTFSRPVRNPSLSFSSFNGTAVLFPHPVYVSGLQGTVAGVSSNSYITSFPATENTVAVIYNGVFNSISFRVAGSDAQGSVLLNIPYVLDAGALTYTLTSGSPFGYLDIDTDGDGIVNRLDLDSDGDGDGDGCPDAREASVSSNSGASASMSASGGSIYTGGIPSGTANAYVGNGTPSQYGANGFFNGIETAAESGVYNGTYTYAIYALTNTLNLCTDTDGDGVINFIDIDDDNDGVVDAVESPACFYTSSEWNTGAKPVYGVTISSGLATTTSNFSELIDGVSGTTAVAFSASPTQAIANANVYLFNFIQPVRLDALYLQFNTTTQFGGTTKIQGSNTNNGSDWVDLSASIAAGSTSNTTVNGSVTVTSSMKYPVTLNTTTAYKYIRITGVAASNIAAQNASEVYFDFNNTAYVASSFPKAIICNNDPDNDTIPNHLDLDSDGDGCPDAKEANVSSNPGAAASMSTSGGSFYTGGIPSGTANAYVGNGTPGQYGANGLFNDIETGENGIYNSTYTYQFANNNALNACLDTDGDGVGDLIDIDDDNDGILDTLEQNCPNGSKTGVIVTKPAAITYNFNSAQTLANLVDGVDSNTLVMYNPTPPAALINAEWFRVEFPTARILSSWEVGHFGGQTLFSTTSTYKVQGSNNGTTWTDLTGTLTYSNTQSGQSTQANSSNVADFSSNLSAYKYYRYYGINGIVGNGWATEFYFKDGGCVDIDTDGDGIPNRLDLDSDGDTCPDAVEAGVSSNSGASASMSTSGGAIYTGGIASGSTNAYVGNGTPSQYGANGFFNSIETTADSGLYNNAYTYAYANTTVINLCADTDGDGVNDFVDIDDDNDGILDAVESPSCFYTGNEFESGNRSSFVTVTSGLNMTSPYNTPQKLVDGDNGTAAANYAVNFVNSQSNVGTNIYTFEFLASVKLSNIYLGYVNANSHFINGAVAKLQGSNNGNTWTDLNAGATYNQASTNAALLSQGTQNYQLFTVSQNAAKYKYYRITGVSGTIWSGGYSNEAYFQVASDYVASSNPKLTCVSDTDGDLIPNHRDLDSDGDGCPDALEAGVSSNAGAFTSMSSSSGSLYTGGIPSGTANAYVGNGTPSQYGANGFFNGIETAADSGIYNGTYTYSQYALTSAVNACTDTDGDGVPDVFDIDDDNDGVLDTVEQTCVTAGYNTNSSSNISNLFSQYGIVSGNTLFTQLASSVGLIFSDSSSFTSGMLMGNACSEPAIMAGNSWNSDMWFKSVDPANISRAVPLKSISFKMDCASGTPEYSSYTAYDINGNELYSQTITSPTASNERFDLVMNPAYNVYRIKVTRNANAAVLIGITLKEGFGVAICDQDIDTDNDGIPNRLDLDSDGDGCPDTKEAILYNHITEASIAADVKNGSGGAVTSTVNMPNAMVPGPYGSNGFADALQLSTNPDAYKYIYTYLFVATNADVSTCSNKFLYDIDSDDDGIPDAVESPSCFYTEAQAMDITEGVTSDFGWTTANPLSKTYDDITLATNYGEISAPTATSIQNKALITFNLPVIDAAFINSVTLNVGSPNFGAGKWKLQGLDMMTNTWMDLSASAGQALNTTGNIVFNNTLQNNTRYYSYRILGVDNVNIVNAARLIEFTIQYKNYNASYHRTKMGCSSDADGDGVPNYIDRDSDGDGCPDAVEAGIPLSKLVPGDFFNIGGVVSGNYVTVGGNYGDNGLGDDVETAPDSGIVNYTSTYTQYATNKTLNFCTDTDGDSVPDLIDLDDDNDGILDTTECTYPALPTTTSTVDVFATWSNTTTAAGTNGAPTYLTSVGSWTAGSGLTAAISGGVVNISNVNGSTLGDAFGANEYLEHPFTTTADNYNSLYYIRSSASNATNYHWAMLISDDNFVTYTILNIDMLRNATGVAINDINDYQLKPSTAYKVRTYYWGAPAFTFDEFTMFGYSECDTDSDGVPNRLDLDSDGDGCPDAKESGVAANSGATASMSSSGGSIYTGGIASGTAEAYVGNGTPAQYGNNGFFNGIETAAESGLYNGTYTYASVINATISACFCYKPAITAGTVLDTYQGITSLQRAGTDNSDWPMVRKGAWTALESKTKAFVPNRLTITEINSIPVENLKEGMMVYNISSNCIYINTDGTAGGWKCFNTQACP